MMKVTLNLSDEIINFLECAAIDLGYFDGADYLHGLMLRAIFEEMETMSDMGCSYASVGRTKDDDEDNSLLDFDDGIPF